MPRRNRPRRPRLAAHRLLRYKAVTFTIAAMGMCQLPICFPDFLGALNFELQSLITGVLINAVDIIVRNVLGL